MNVRNCVKCGKIFNYVAGKPICQSCKNSMEDQFKETKTYIKKNPDCSIAEVAENCSVDIKQIKEWVREERLTFSKDSAVGIDCELCGKSIRTGRFCAECKAKMANDLSGAYDNSHKESEKNPFSKEKTAKMRFMDKENRRR